MRCTVCTCIASAAILKLRFAARRVRRQLHLARRTLNFEMQHKTECSTTVWDPLCIFSCPADYKYALVVLNCPIRWKQNILLRIWQEAQVTVTVDGGTQRWLKYLEEQSLDVLSGEHNEYVPALIVGDLDSSSPELVKKLKDIGSQIIKTPDQDNTDYTKALIQLGRYSQTKSIHLNEVYVLAETSGRFDHIIGNINTLYKTSKTLDNIKIIQVASNSLTWLLQPGLHKILIPDILVHQSCWCGLLPFGSPVTSITTTGLKWNLNKACLNFGGLVSTSNTYEKSTEVTITTDTPVVWTMGIEPIMENISNNVSSPSDAL